MRHIQHIAAIAILAIAATCLPTETTARSTAAGYATVLRLKGQAAGDSFVVSWQLLLDSLRLPSTGTVVYIPVVEDTQGHTATLRPVVVNGRRAHYAYLRDRGNKSYPDAIELYHKRGEAQSYTYREVVPLEAWMTDGRVRIAVDTCGCGNLVGQDAGTPRDVNPHLERRFVAAYLPPVAGDDPVLSLKGRAYIDFPVNRTELYPNYHNNPAELHKIMQTIDTVRNNSNVEITAISIHGYASPEGSWSNNVRLAEGRAATLKEYVSQQYDFPASLWHVASTPEDWDGLDSFLVKSNITDREAILDIVRSDMQPDPKNERIKQEFPEQYAIILASCYPYLRHSDYEVQYKIRPMSDAEAEQLLTTSPELLSLNKMYRIANLHEPGSDAYNRAIETAARIYPNDPVANVNAANVALREHDLERADYLLSKAGTSPEATHARGVLALLQGNTDEARQLLTEAQAAGISAATDNLRLLDEQ